MATRSKGTHYATGIVLVTVGAFGVIGAVTGELANMLAALWVPDALVTSSGKSADSSTNSSGFAAPNPLASPKTNFDAGYNDAANAVSKIPVIGKPLVWLTNKL